MLLLRRTREPETEHWGIPGGKVNFMEPVELAVIREVHEETGLEVRLLELLCLVDHFEPELSPPQHWVSPVFLAEPVGSDDAQRREPEAFSGLDWFATDALPVPLTKSTIRAIAALSATQGVFR